MRIRSGVRDDVPLVLSFGDEAVAWMNARGNTQQWRTEPWTGNPEREATFLRHADVGGLRILEDEDGTPLGAMAITEERQAYVPAVDERELYVNFLISSRRHSGRGIGRMLIARAKQEAAERGIDLIRVDCWAGEDGNLVKVYESYGFSRVQEFFVGEWPGMLLAMRLSELSTEQRPASHADAASAPEADAASAPEADAASAPDATAESAPTE